MWRIRLPGTAMLLLSFTFSALASPGDPAVPPTGTELAAGRQTLPGGDGWASLPTAALPADVIERFNGTRLTDRGNCLKGKYACVPTDFVATWNTSFDPDLTPDAGWTPTLYGADSSAAPADQVRESVLAGSGPFGSPRP